MTIRSDITMFWESSPRIIQVDAPSTEISMQDLIDTCSHLSFQAANMDDDILLESSGKEYLIEDGSVKVGLTVTLNNAKIAFEARSGPSWVLCSIEGGNAVAVEDIYATPRVYFDVRKPTAYTSVDRVSASSATLSELSAIQYASFGGGVTIDVINGEAGTDYPIGTIETPVSNLTHAVAIANTRGFDALFISNSMSLDSGTNIQNFTLIGKSSTHVDVVIEPSAICDNIVIQNCNVSGTLDGGTEINHCSIGNLLYVNGHIHESGIYGTIVLGGNESAVITDCYTIDQDNPPTIDMGGSGQDLAMFNYSGIVNVKNLSSASEEIAVGIDAGVVVLEDTITAGTIIISGIGQLIDNSTGTANVDTDGLMSKQTITEISWGAIYIDTTISGNSGTTFPIGTAGTPSNNITDACTIANNNNIKIFKLRGSIDLPQIFEDYTFVGIGSILNDIVNLNSQTINGCRFEALTVSGTVSASDSVYLRCSIRNVIGLDGLFIDSVLQGTLTMGGIGSTVTGQNIAAYGNAPGSPAVINMGGGGRVFQASLDGAIYFTTAASGSAIEVGLKNGTVILDPTCTGGTALFTGVGDLVNYSAMSVTNGLLTESSISDAVWTENLGDHSGVSGSTAEALAQAAVASGTIEASVSEQDKLDIADRVWSTTMSGFNQDSTGDVLDRIHTATEITQATVTGVSATTTSFETNLTEITDDFWERSSFLFTAGNNIGQMRGIKFYTGATKEIEVETPLPFVPVDGDQFIITANRKFLAPEAYQNVIYYNEDNGIAGTEYPIGLYEYPVNNLTDALIIAADRNIDRISTRSDMTIEAGHDVSKMSIETHGIMGTDILFESGCSANNTTVKYANVSGEITNGDVLLLESCSIGNLENFSGIMNVATFGQGSEVSVENWANFISCHAGGAAGNEPELNIGTADVNINKYTGNLKLIGKTGTNRTVANFQSGNVIVGSTCVSGTIQILGIGAIERDDSGPNCKVDIDAAITKATIASAVWDESLSIHDNLGSPGAAFIGLTYGGKVCIDAITGVSGTTYPTGLPLQPVNNLADAKIIADINNIREFQLYSNLVISPGVSIDDYIFQAEQDVNVVMMLQAGCTTQNSRFHHLILTGTFDGKSYIDHSTTLDISNYSGFIIDTIFMGDIGVVDPSVPSLFSLCGGGKTNSVVEIDLGDSSLNIGGWKSEAKLVNKTSTSSNIIELMSGEVTIDSTCVSGSIFVKGIGRLIADNSGPNCTVNTTELVNRYVIADEVWDELTVDHSDVGSYGEWASTIADNIVRTLGLTQENYYLDNTTYTQYSGAKLLTSGRLRIYSVAGSVGTSSNVISTYQITSVWTGDELDTYKVVKQ